MSESLVWVTAWCSIGNQPSFEPMMTKFTDMYMVARPQWVNSLGPSDASVNILTLVQIMACHMFGAKPLSEPMLPYCQLDPKEHISVKFPLKFKSFHSINPLKMLSCEMSAILSRPQYVKWLISIQCGQTEAVVDHNKSRSGLRNPENNHVTQTVNHSRINPVSPFVILEFHFLDFIMIDEFIIFSIIFVSHPQFNDTSWDSFKY